MQQFLQCFILLPLFAFIGSLITPAKKEKLLSRVAIATTGLHLAACTLFIVLWLANGYETLDIKHIVLYHSESFEFFINFYFDLTTAVYAVVGAAITLMVAIFSRYYLHRDEGFKRFFSTLLLFFLGYNLVVFSGNFETLFIGWEILGFCSFLLIAFYRDRYLPVKNAIKVISVYRLGDVCLMLAMWMCHYIFHSNVTFLQLTDHSFVLNHHLSDPYFLAFASVMIVVAAAAKSAMLPFSSWLPRAMEGPTTSSAVFYGSLSIHLGAFLLLRTFPLWENLLSVKLLIIVLGIATSLIATSIASVQSTVKTQIAYSSITQIGLIFIEVALGFHILALVHFAGNAFLRTYQLLVSPSVLNYEIHDMIFNFKPRQYKESNSFSAKVKNTVYMLSIKEWNIDRYLYTFLWSPFKWIGRQSNFMSSRGGMLLLGVLLVSALLYFPIEDTVPGKVDSAITIICALIGLFCVLKAFSTRTDATIAWFLIITGQIFITMSIALNEPVSLHQVVLYLSGISVAAVIGYLCLKSIEKIDHDISLNRFHGYSYERPWTAFIFLLACLALLGFPFTPTFIGIDLLFTHIHDKQYVLLAATSLSFIFIEIAILRIYARVFLGQHKKNYHPIAYRSS